MIIGYKGTDKDMKCRDFQYELGKTYYIEDGKMQSLGEGITMVPNPKKDESLRCCTDKVIHYCDKLDDVSTYYSFKQDNRFFKVEILGGYCNERNKSGATALRFLEEIDMTEFLKKKEDEREDRDLGLDKVRALQNQFTHLILGGSLALYLQGAQLKRLKDGSVNDFDLIHPFYVDLTEFEGVEHLDAKNSGNTFDETYAIGNIKIDLSICNETKYKVVEYKGHKYKVNTVEDVLSYKCQYAKQKNGTKHRDDIHELIGIKG